MKKLIAVLFVCFVLITPAAMAQTPEPAVSIDQPMLPDFACTDTSYADAVANGITLGITPDFPYTYLSDANEPEGIDVTINNAVLALDRHHERDLRDHALGLADSGPASGTDRYHRRQHS